MVSEKCMYDRYSLLLTGLHLVFEQSVRETGQIVLSESRISLSGVSRPIQLFNL